MGTILPLSWRTFGDLSEVSTRTEPERQYDAPMLGAPKSIQGTSVWLLCRTAVFVFTCQQRLRGRQIVPELEPAPFPGVSESMTCGRNWASCPDICSGLTPICPASWPICSLPSALWICSAEIGRFWPVDTHDLTISPIPPCWKDWTSPARPPVWGLLTNCMTTARSELLPGSCCPARLPAALRT